MRYSYNSGRPLVWEESRSLNAAVCFVASTSYPSLGLSFLRPKFLPQVPPVARRLCRRSTRGLSPSARRGVAEDRAMRCAGERVSHTHWTGL